LKGPIKQGIYDDDIEYDLTPENLFQYLFGVAQFKCYGLIEIANGKTTIFVELPTTREAVWEKFLNLEDYKNRYEIDDALAVTELENYLKQYNPDGTVYLYKGKNPYSGLETLNPEEDFKDILSKRKVDTEHFYEYSCESRVHKTPKEIDMI